MRTPINPEERVAITLYWLADTGGFSRVSDAFGVARSTISGIVSEVCSAMEEELLGQIIRLESPGRVSNLSTDSHMRVGGRVTTSLVRH